jgi:Transposase DDE domain
MYLLGKTPGMMERYFSDIWEGSDAMARVAKQYAFGLVQEQEIFSKKWIADHSGEITLRQSDYFLREGKWDERRMNINRLHLINGSRQSGTRDEGVLIIDDTGVRRYKKDDERGIGWQYSGELDGVGYCKIVVTAHYADGKRNFPIELECYYKGEESKVELAKSLIGQAITSGIRFSTVIFDSWYFCKELTGFIASKGKFWISQPKDNRNAILEDGRKMKVSSLVTATSTDSSGLLLGHLSDLGKVGFVRMEGDEEGKGRVVATNALSLNADEVRHLYDLRVIIEQFYRIAKQQMNFRSFRVHDAVQISRHWYLIFAVYTFCMLAKLKGWLSKIVSFAIRCVSDVVKALRLLNSVQLTQKDTNVYMAMVGLKVLN